MAGIPFAYDMSWVREISTNRGHTLGALSDSRKVMLVFLRHFGCTFCREAMADLHRVRMQIASQNTELILVHQMSETYAQQIMEIYGLEDTHRISDPNLELYKAFNLKRGGLRQMFSLRVWLHGFRAGILKGHFVGRERGDGWQMPGVFIYHKGRILDAFVHEYASDRPDYVKLAACEAPH
ncbi:MAG: redoxin domain-containing protein [Leptolyngbya sp. SIO3F4]|nr:redoxin domain-containing protein [Leptolyngbya sp. SIO3F4]